MPLSSSKYAEEKRNFLDTLMENIEKVIDREMEKFDNGQTLPNEPSVVSFVRGVYFLTLAKFTNPIAHQMAWRAVERISVEDNSITD